MREGGEAAQRAACVRLSVFGVAGLQWHWHWHTAGRGPQFFQSHSGRSELVAVGGVDVAIPELIGEAEEISVFWLMRASI